MMLLLLLLLLVVARQAHGYKNLCVNLMQNARQGAKWPEQDSSLGLRLTIEPGALVHQGVHVLST